MPIDLGDIRTAYAKGSFVRIRPTDLRHAAARGCLSTIGGGEIRAGKKMAACRGLPSGQIAICGGRGLAQMR